MRDIIIDTLKDTLTLIPFLFLTYLLMEFIEHKTSEKTENGIKKAGRFGPAIGGIIGIVPQCGFSASAASLYSGGVISAGTMLAVFLSTSDEMLPILISEKVKPSIIIEILLIKAVIAITAGFAADIIIRFHRGQGGRKEIHSLCDHDHCHCDEKGIFRSAIHHTLQITLFILIITFALNCAVHYIGEEALGKLFVSKPVIGCVIASLIGLIPNCAASVAITELYLSGIIGAGAMLSGLLTGSGIGLLVLFRTNKKSVKANFAVLLTLVFTGIIAGVIIEITGISF